jgi:DNA-binding CsgD family transcriptional regulator
VSPLRKLAVAMIGARAIGEGADLLVAAGTELGLPIIGALDDMSRLEPLCDENGARLADRFGWPKDFVDRWVEKAYTLTNPVFIQSRFSHLPFVWMLDDAAQATDGEVRTTRRVADGLASIGIAGGLAVPVRLTYGRIGGVHWWGRKSRAELQALLDAHGPDLFVLANYFFALFPRRPATTPEDLASLTMREVECLTLAASGSSDVEIGRALHLSQHTVRFHIDNAADKLGARTRTHAIALAAQLGVIGKAG